MNSFRNHKLRDLTLPTSTAWLIADIAEAKGKQELFLAIIRRACNEFEQRAGQIKSPRGAKSALVIDAVGRQPHDFSVADLQTECPGVSLDMIRHVLDRLRKEKKVKCLGTGRNARWQKTETR